MRRNLVPERIVNKNGVHTTVYRKRDGAESQGVVGIPPVEIAQPEMTIGSISMMVKTACSKQYGGTEVDTNRIARTLRGFHSRTVHRVSRFIDSKEIDREGSKECAVAHSLIKGHSEEYISDYMNFSPVIRSFSMIKPLRQYPQLGNLPVDAIDSDSDTYRSTVALMEVSDFIRRTYDQNYVADRKEPFMTFRESWTPKYIVLEDSRLVDLILKRHEDAEKIMAIIDSHKSADYEVIVAALDNGTVLAEGTL